MEIWKKLKEVLLKHLALSLVLVGFVFIFYIVSCQDLSFDAIPKFRCDDGNVDGVECEEVPEDNLPNDDFTGNFKTNIKTRLGKVDILFVLDNSHSMKEELRSISDQFDDFLNTIEQVDYNIGVITTDWKNDRGEFLVFPNDKIFLSNPEQKRSVHERNVDQFRSLLRHLDESETDDERGIYVLNMALDNSQNSEFFRPHSLFMVIIVSDEDERSHGGKIPEGAIGDVLPLTEMDRPETFFRKVTIQNKFSVVVVHSIIVKENDSVCLRESKGEVGRIYTEASEPTARILNTFGNIQEGKVISICSRNYSSQLGKIADYLGKVPPIPLPCFPEKIFWVKVDGERLRVSDYEVKGRKIEFTTNTPFGEEAEVSFVCRD